MPTWLRMEGLEAMVVRGPVGATGESWANVFVAARRAMSVNANVNLFMGHLRGRGGRWMRG